MGAAAHRQASGYTIEQRVVEWEQAYASQLAPVGVR
jgi:hypothetical protein